MAIPNLNSSDLWFTSDGDYLIDGAGDLRDTSDSGDKLEGLRQAIIHRVIAERGAMRLHPNLSAGLESFIGRPIDANLMDGVQTSIHRALTGDGSLSRSEYEVRVFELTPGNIAVLIYVRLPGQEHPLVSMAWNVNSGEVTRVV